MVDDRLDRQVGTLEVGAPKGLPRQRQLGRSDSAEASSPKSGHVSIAASDT